jgi:predicted kinase
MKKPILVILRGKPAAGKSTAYANLRKKKAMKNWLFVDHCKLKEDLGKELGKESLFAVLKTVMPSKKNIIIEEMSEKTVMKHLGKEVKKHNYKIIVFQFEISLKKSRRRDYHRVIDKEHDRKFILKNIEDLHKMHDERFDKKGFLIDADKLSKRQVVEFILSELRL